MRYAKQNDMMLKPGAILPGFGTTPLTFKLKNF